MSKYAVYVDWIEGGTARPCDGVTSGHPIVAVFNNKADAKEFAESQTAAEVDEGDDTKGNKYDVAKMDAENYGLFVGTASEDDYEQIGLGDNQVTRPAYVSFYKRFPIGYRDHG